MLPLKVHRQPSVRSLRVSSARPPIRRPRQKNGSHRLDMLSTYEKTIMVDHAVHAQSRRPGCRDCPHVACRGDCRRSCRSRATSARRASRPGMTGARGHGRLPAAQQARPARCTPRNTAPMIATVRRLDARKPTPDSLALFGAVGILPAATAMTVPLDRAMPPPVMASGPTSLAPVPLSPPPRT